MKKLIIICSLLWFPAILFTWTPDAGFFYWRHQLTMLSGIIAVACMTVSMLLAMRFRWIENLVNGLDNGYAIHKQMGIGALVSLCIHWLIIQLPGWLIPLGWIAAPNRGPRPQLPADTINWTHVAKEVGNYTFYIFLIFAAISLIQLIRYRHFKWTHNIAGAIYLAGAFHSLLLMDLDWTSVASDIFIVLMCIIGSVCAVISLTGKIGSDKRASGTITNVESISSEGEEPDIAHFTITLDSALNYREGQFAFIDFNDGEPSHPFSVLNYNRVSHEIEFAVKDLGDYTHKLITRLNTSQSVQVEGCYGRFQIPSSPQQAWIGAGIGIVPLISWLNQLVKNGQARDKTIHLFYCRRSASDSYFLDMINRLIGHLPFIQLHIYTSQNGERLTSQQIADVLALSQASVCFCGPVTFSAQLRSDLVAYGLNENDFHAERFKMR